MLTALCEQIEGIPISGVIVVGDGQAARSIALSGNAMKVPVLWAKGGNAQLYAGGSEVSVSFCLFSNPRLVNKIMFSLLFTFLCHIFPSLLIPSHVMSLFELCKLNYQE